MKKIFLLLGLLFFAGCDFTGIGLVAGGAGVIFDMYIMWKEGEATKYYNYDVSAVYRATKHAAETLNLKLISDDNNSKESNGYYLKALDVNNKDKFKIKIVPAAKNSSKLCVRINFMGDKPYAELLYKTVDDQLNTIEFKQGKPAAQRKLLKFRRSPQNPRTFFKADGPNQ